MFTESIGRTSPVRQLSSHAQPFDAFAQITDRPFAGSIIWPVLPKEQYDTISHYDLYIGAAYFLALSGG
jgi:hypothetical protein